MLHRVPLHIRVFPETRQRLKLLRTQRHPNVGSWLHALMHEALEEQKTTDGQRPRRARLEDAHNPISPMRTQGQPTTPLDGLGRRVSGVATSQDLSTNVLNSPVDSRSIRGI